MPRVLVCTNFILTWFIEEDANRKTSYGGSNATAATLRDYGGTVEAHQRGRARLLDYLDALVDDGRYEVVLRPHPNEEHSFYQRWIDGLSPARRARLLYEPRGSITSLILNCDLEISCGLCNGHRKLGCTQADDCVAFRKASDALPQAIRVAELHL